REDAAQVGVATEQDAVEIERLALEPVGRRPDADHGVDDGLIAVVRVAQADEPQARVVRDREQLIGDAEARTMHAAFDIRRTMPALARFALVTRRADPRDAAATEPGASGRARLPLVAAVDE